jgi:hypothetical protein
MQRIVRLLSVSVCALLFAPPRRCYGCILQGQDSGVCTPSESLDIPFCADVVKYTACAPRYQELFPNHTAFAKDKWVRQTYDRVIAARINAEREGADIGVGAFSL